MTVPTYPSFNFYPIRFLLRTALSTPTRITLQHTRPRHRASPSVCWNEKTVFSIVGIAPRFQKLRVACAAGALGQRSMWSHCEQCGAIEMIDPATNHLQPQSLPNAPVTHCPRRY
ncbi:hypothetical protein F5148DRAFT_498640 [Russula earlei]|uniref:Uncharacterized protein n=1 Tax=Russula earlei TaxID=71964 RepID=A0ACC0UGG7_9AGAM|nr:hypothetical protein F5148DRAFT_498640 [Russula earlei]